MNTESLWISIKLRALKLKYLIARLVGFSGLAIAAFGGYVTLEPGARLEGASTLLNGLPLVEGLTPMDGVLLLILGCIIVAISTRI